MKSYSQASQDAFVVCILDGKRDGSFLEIGTNNPVEINNTYLLETEFNWRGMMVDNSMESMLAAEHKRKSAFYLADVSQKIDWIAALRQAEEINHGTPLHAPRRYDYLSLDVDQASLDCLRNLPLDDVRFSVITLEHDEYRRPGTRDQMLQILNDADYDILCADVCDKGLSFEIWAVDRWALNIPKEAKEKFRRDKPTEWQEFFR